LVQAKGKIHLHSAAFAHMPSTALSSQTRPPFNLGRSRPSPHARTLTCAAIQPHIAYSAV